MQQRSQSRGKNRRFRTRARALDLENAGGDRANPPPTRPTDPCAMTHDLSHHHASAAAGPEPQDHTAGGGAQSALIFSF